MSMTGIDLLRDELRKRGLNESQVISKVTAEVLDVLTQSGETNLNIYKTEYKTSKRLAKLKREVSSLENAIWAKERELRSLEFECQQKKGNLEATRDEVQTYINEFNQKLQEGETASGRDALRCAQMFVNSVNVDTKDDNAAFIIGLASILSHGNVSAINELRNINKAIPKPTEPIGHISVRF